MVSEYTSMLLQMPECGLPQSPGAALVDHLSHRVEYISSPTEYAVVSEEPIRAGRGNVQIGALEAHTGLGDAGSKACSKCRVSKPMAEFFKDKSKPDGLYSQCKACATSEERRRREERALLPSERTKQAKTCTRCGAEKDVKQFCRNSRSFDGRYSQCRTCVANKDKSRRERLVERRDEPVEAKVCSRCNIDKHNSEFYRDSSKPDGLQTYCKKCLCNKNKTTRKKKRKTGREHLAGSVAFADGAQVPVSEAGALQPTYQPDEQLTGPISMSAAMTGHDQGSLSTSQMHCGYPLQDEAPEGQNRYDADSAYNAAPQQEGSLQTHAQQQQRYAREQPGGPDRLEERIRAYLPAQADFSGPEQGCSFHQEPAVSHFMSSGAYPGVSTRPQSSGHPVQQGNDVMHAEAHHAVHFERSPGAYQEQDGFPEQEAYQEGMHYLSSRYGAVEDATQQNELAESSEPLGYLNSEIQEHRSRLAATMLV